MTNSIMPTYARTDLAFVKGEGAYLFTGNGERYLDFVSGIAVTNLGHSHPALVAAVTEQAGQLWHTSNLYNIPEQERLADRLVENSFADLVFFGNSGAEAVEGAIKTARKYQSANGNPERYRVLTTEGAFHGRTLATISAGGNPNHLDGFGPEMTGFDHIDLHNLESVKEAITEETAAILIEPVRGEGGILVVPDDVLQGLRDIADEHGLILIFDEVQCGMGRTGKLFAYEWSGVEPDIMALAKGLGGGFPVGAFLATSEAAKGMTPGTHGSTFGGNYLAMAAANAVLDVILEDGFLEHVQYIGNYFTQQLGAILEKHSELIDTVVGRGLHLGIKCKMTNGDFGAAVLKRQMLTVVAGDNQLRMLPPLTIDETTVGEAIAILDAALDDIAAGEES